MSRDFYFFFFLPFTQYSGIALAFCGQYKTRLSFLCLFLSAPAMVLLFESVILRASVDTIAGFDSFCGVSTRTMPTFEDQLYG